MTEFDDLASMAVNVRRSLHWATFLLAAMILILVIDLQLKRSIARQAIGAARLLSEAAGRTSEREPVDPPAGDSNHRGGSSSDHVDGGPPVAAGSDPASDPLEAAVARHPSSRTKRAPRNGGRVARPES